MKQVMRMIKHGKCGLRIFPGGFSLKQKCITAEQISCGETSLKKTYFGF